MTKKGYTFLVCALLLGVLLALSGCGSASSPGEPASAPSAPPQEETAESGVDRIRSGDLQVGDVLSFGKQDKIGSSVREPVSWKVLAVEEGRALLVSEYILDSARYASKDDLLQKYGTTDDVLNENDAAIAGIPFSYSNASVKDFVNSFYATWFNDEERALILQTTLTDPRDPEPETDAYVFLLSYEEAERYFSSDAERICYGTGYAQGRGLVTIGDGPGIWWLRSPGDESFSACYVDAGGVLQTTAGPAEGGGIGIRPALWVRLGDG